MVSFTKTYPFTDDSKWTLDPHAEITGGKLQIKATDTASGKTYSDTFTNAGEYSFDANDVVVSGGEARLKLGWRDDEVFVAPFDIGTPNYPAAFSKSGGSLVGTLVTSGGTPATVPGTPPAGAPKKPFDTGAFENPNAGTASHYLEYDAAAVRFASGGNKGTVGLWFRTTNITELGSAHRPLFYMGNGLLSPSIVKDEHRIIIFILADTTPDRLQARVFGSNGTSSLVVTQALPTLAADTWYYVSFEWDMSGAAGTKVARLYLDSVLLAEADDSSSPDAGLTRDDTQCTKVWINRDSTYFTNLQGWIDDLVCYEVLKGTFVPTTFSHDVYPPSSDILRVPAVEFQTGVPFGVDSYDTFSETTTTPALTTVTYQISTDGGATYLYWNGGAWVTATTLWNTATEVNTGLPSLGTSETDFTWKVRLSTSDPDETPKVDINTVTYTALVYWQDNPTATLNSGEGFDFNAITFTAETKNEPLNTALTCRISNSDGAVWKYWDGSAFQETTTAWGDMNGTHANLGLLTSGSFRIVIRLETTDPFETPDVDNLVYTYTEATVEPVEVIVNEEVTTEWRFDFSAGYTFDPVSVEFVDGEARLKDLGGGTYATSAIITSPDWIPTVNLAQYIRTELFENEPTGTTVEISMQVSNDGGLQFGIRPPYYNDGEWLAVDSELLTDFFYLKTKVQPAGKGLDRVRFMVTILSDGATQAGILGILMTSVAILTWTPTYATRAEVAALGGMSVGDIPEEAHRAGEFWVSKELLLKSIDIDQVKDALTAEQDLVLDEALKAASAFRTFCIMAKTGAGKQTPAGAVTGASADGMSTTFGRTTPHYKEHEYSASDWCGMSGMQMDNVIRLAKKTLGVRIVEMKSANRELRDIERGRYDRGRRGAPWRPL
jgi:hypothetical protein